MNQIGQTLNTSSTGELPKKRKRGRPRKNESSAQENNMPALPSNVMSNSQSVGPRNNGSNITVGQAVSGFIHGKFDEGYLVTVKAGDTYLRGTIFMPGRVTPITPSNDVAPHLKMIERHSDQQQAEHHSNSALSSEPNDNNQFYIPAPISLDHVTTAEPISSVQAALAQDQSVPIKVPFMDDFLKSDSNLSLERKLTLEKIMSSGVENQPSLFMSHLKQNEFGQGFKVSQESIDFTMTKRADGGLEPLTDSQKEKRPAESPIKPSLESGFESKSSCSASQMKRDGVVSQDKAQQVPEAQVLMGEHNIGKEAKEDLKQGGSKPFVDYLLGKSGDTEYPVQGEAMGSNIKLREFICEQMMPPSLQRNQASYTEPNPPSEENAPKDMLPESSSRVHGDNISPLNKNQLNNEFNVAKPDENPTSVETTPAIEGSAAIQKTGDNLSDYAPKASILVSNIEISPTEPKLATEGSSLPLMLGNQLNDNAPKAT